MEGSIELGHMDRRESTREGILRELLAPSSLSSPASLPHPHLLQFLQRVENTVKFGDCFLGKKSCC